MNPQPQPTPAPVDPALAHAIAELLAYCRAHQWAGWDPYDALNSQVLQSSRFSDRAVFRLALTQLLKRLPWNLRPFLRVPRGQNPKGVALFVSALVKLAQINLSRPAEAVELAQRLLELRTPGLPRTCWGYDFDWQSRDGFVPKWTPNVICTSFAANALLDVHGHYPNPALLAHAVSAATFLMETLRRTGPDGITWFSYTPRSKEIVHNANLLGAALLARLDGLAPSSGFLTTALEAAHFSLRAQNADGSWFYGDGCHQRWIDSFHTGYNLVALHQILLRATLPEIQRALERGFAFFRGHFLSEEGYVSYYHDRVFPIDTHCLAQAILTLLELRHYAADNADRAQRIAHWALQHMRNGEASFYYQRHRWITNRISYMRWTQAWMLLAMTELALVRRSDRPPAEAGAATASASLCRGTTGL